ncbi:hypothetical protein YPPY06_2959, partial [Yersinia pestis PY-06]
MPDMTQER